MAWYVAVYSGPCGPISKEFEASDTRDALDVINADGKEWYDAGEDDLELRPGASSETISETLKDQGYSDNLRSNDPLWSLYRQVRHALEWWNWHTTLGSPDNETAAARCLAWLRGESTDGPE